MSSDNPPGAHPELEDLSLAKKIDRLFITMHPKDRGEWTYREVSEGVRELGTSISPSYLWQLRKGERTNPTIRQISALADFFHVPVMYFFGSTSEVEAVDAQLSLVRAMRDKGVREVALRAATLSPAGLRAISGLISELQGVTGMSSQRQRKKPRDGAEPADE
jgi:transcriptional regulator with XRE-family HTH domain